ncbi:DUF1214 domain-containing protein [Flavobacterium ustbae]|uniref:DUF1214 domain-containing protein n=1 Tax=Flavobacterium TaxID=237 RepID=UPI000F7B97D1
MQLLITDTINKYSNKASFNKLLAKNDLNRYKLGGDSNGLKRNNDGSFEIIIQKCDAEKHR